MTPTGRLQPPVADIFGWSALDVATPEYLHRFGFLRTPLVREDPVGLEINQKKQLTRCLARRLHWVVQCSRFSVPERGEWR
jgi:hypothetical protein